MRCLVEVGSSGHAIITTSDRKTYTFRPEDGVLEADKKFGLNMFLQPALESAFEQWEIDDVYPFEKIVERITKFKKTHNALGCFLHSLDPELTAEMRQKCARKAEREFQDDSVDLAFLRERLINTPMSSEWDTTYGPKEGRAGEILREMIRRWRS